MDRLISENLILSLFDGKVEHELPIFSKTMTKIIKGLPSAEPKTGHWIKMPLIEAGQTYSHECSLCGRRILTTNAGLSEFPYCHCGAKMIEPQEGVIRND